MNGKLVATVTLAVAAVVGCGSQQSNSAPESPTTTTTTATTTTQVAAAPYDGAAYAEQVQTAILDSFAVSSFADACPQPDWVCAISTIESPNEGWIDVTLQPDWEQVFGEWTGPPAGVGCAKWGERLTRNIENFVQASGVTRPKRVAVYQPNGDRC